jgi:hypothetical protein
MGADEVIERSFYISYKYTLELLILSICNFSSQLIEGI